MFLLGLRNVTCETPSCQWSLPYSHLFLWPSTLHTVINEREENKMTCKRISLPLKKQKPQYCVCLCDSERGKHVPVYHMNLRMTGLSGMSAASTLPRHCCCCCCSSAAHTVNGRRLCVFFLWMKLSLCWLCDVLADNKASCSVPPTCGRGREQGSGEASEIWQTGSQAAQHLLCVEVWEILRSFVLVEAKQWENTTDDRKDSKACKYEDKCIHRKYVDMLCLDVTTSFSCSQSQQTSGDGWKLKFQIGYFSVGYVLMRNMQRRKKNFNFFFQKCSWKFFTFWQTWHVKINIFSSFQKKIF